MLSRRDPDVRGAVRAGEWGLTTTGAFVKALPEVRPAADRDDRMNGGDHEF